MKIFVLFVLALLVVCTSCFQMNSLQSILCKNRRHKSLFSMVQKEASDVIMNRYSRVITEPPSQGASQAMLYATGLTPETIKLPQVR